MKNFIQHVVYSHREGLRWYFKSTERKGTFVISLYPWDIRLLKYGLYLLIPPLKETHIKGNSRGHKIIKIANNEKFSSNFKRR